MRFARPVYICNFNKYTKFNSTINHKQLNMLSVCQGKIKMSADEVNLDLTLLGGQSFRWHKSININKEAEWCGVAYNVFWILQQTQSTILYKMYYLNDVNSNSNGDLHYSTKYSEDLLRKYLRLDFNLPEYLCKWRLAHNHFREIPTNVKGVRVLHQEPLENIISFICSQNNHIKRISSMINWLCSKYGQKIVQYDGRDVYAFPSLDSLQENLSDLELILRNAKFGYRAKFICASIKKVIEFGGLKWFDELRSMPYLRAREELIKLPGVGYKVADCVCLMSLNHLESVPIDTHIFKIAQTIYLPKLVKLKNLTPKLYNEICEHFRKVYGQYSGWAQAILFCSDLPQFNLGHVSPEINSANNNVSNINKKKKCIK